MRRFFIFSCISMAFLALCCVSEQMEISNENDTSNRDLPAYIIASKAHLLNSNMCREELREFRNAVDHRILWSLKMLDSSGSPKPGFIYRNNFWLGSRNQCQDTMNLKPLYLAEREILNNTLYRDPRQEFPPFEVNYFVTSFKHNSTLQYHIIWPNEDLITLGLCLPASCSTKDLGLILEEIFRKRILLVSDVYSADFSLVQVKDLKDDHQWLLSGAVLSIGFVLSLTWIMMIVGTMYDILVYQKYLKAKSPRTYYENGTSSLETSNCDTNHSKDASKDGELTSSSLHEESKIGRVLMCFSVYTNTRIIFDTKLTANSIPAIHGLRFLSMAWAIIAHSVYYTMDYFDNLTWFNRMTQMFVMQVFSNSTVVVDTFFFLSGFLLGYVYLSKMADNMQQKPINYATILTGFLVNVIKRFIRLTPAYMTMIGIVYLNSSWYSRTSQFYMSERSHEVCSKYWWRNLLYINNLFDRKTMCLSWSWYLANDMQFFIIGSILLILSTICFYTAVVVLCALLIGTIVFTGYISYFNGYVPTLDEQIRLLSVLYDPPWIRIGPYIIGIITAYIVRRVNKELVLKRRTLILCWCLGGVCNFSVVFCLYEPRISVLVAAFYAALNRTVWAIGLAWILLACCTKHGGIINQFLSFRGWIPLSRLTYCVYLINPFVIYSLHQYGESAAHLDSSNVLVIYFASLIISYLCAYVLSLMSEMPYTLLMQKFGLSRNVKECQDRKFCRQQHDSNSSTTL